MVENTLQKHAINIERGQRPFMNLKGHLEMRTRIDTYKNIIIEYKSC
jgi:hypothetical protein